MPKDSCPLSSLNRGDKAVIIEISSNPDLQEKLKEMGVFEGLEIEVSHKSLFFKKSPIVIEIYDFLLGLRFEEAQSIRVKKVKAEPSRAKNK